MVIWVCYHFTPGIIGLWYETVNQKEETLSTSKILYIAATLLSILASISLYRSEKRELAIFVGLWAPTILDLGQSLVDEERK